MQRDNSQEAIAWAPVAPIRSQADVVDANPQRFSCAPVRRVTDHYTSPPTPPTVAPAVRRRKGLRCEGDAGFGADTGMGAGFYPEMGATASVAAGSFGSFRYLRAGTVRGPDRSIPRARALAGPEIRRRKGGMPRAGRAALRQAPALVGFMATWRQPGGPGRV